MNRNNYKTSQLHTQHKLMSETGGEDGTYLGDGSLHSVPGVSGNGRGGRLSSVSTWLGLEWSHGLGHSRGKSELLSQLNIGPSLGCNKQTQMLVTPHS